MAMTTTYLCDCCGAELASSGLSEAVNLTYLDPQGMAQTMLFCIAGNCGPHLVDAAVAQRKKDHSRRKNAVPDIPAIGRIEPVSD